MRRFLAPLLIPFAVSLSACEKQKEAPPAAKPPAAAPRTATTATTAKAGAYGGGQHENSEERERAAVTRTIAVLVDGKPAGERTVEQLDALPGAKVEDGKHSWPLRELAKSAGGAKARVVAVVNQEKERLEVDPKAWANAQRTPTLRSNRRGDIKFQWEQNGSVLPMEPELRGISTVEISNK